MSSEEKHNTTGQNSNQKKHTTKRKFRYIWHFVKVNRFKFFLIKRVEFLLEHSGIFRIPKAWETVEISKGFHKCLISFIRWNFGLVKACGKILFAYKGTEFRVTRIVSAPDRSVSTVRESEVQGIFSTFSKGFSSNEFISIHFLKQ